MTTEEHVLILQLLFKQRQGMRVLLNILRSRDILTPDDEKAFAAAQTQDVGSNAAIFAEAKAFYIDLARSVGLQTGLENMPDSPAEWFRPAT